MKKLLLIFILLFSTTQVLAAEITDTCRTDIDRTNYTAITSTIQEVVLNIGDALHKKIINKDYDYQISYFGKVIELLDNIENNIGLLTPSKKQILGLLKQQVECKLGYINTNFTNTNNTSGATTQESNNNGEPIIGIENPEILGVDQDYSIPIDTSGAVDVTKAPYFADNTGKTDSREAIQKAMDGNAKIYIPEGRYKISGILYLRSINKLIFGEGTIFPANLGWEFGIATNNGNPLRDFILDGITIEDIGIAMYFNENDNGMIGHNITIQNLTFNETQYRGDFGALLQFDTWSNYGYIGVNIFNNKFINGRRGGISVRSEGNGILTNAWSNVNVKGNTLIYDQNIAGSWDIGWTIAMSTGGGDNLKFSHNYIQGYQWGIEDAASKNSIIEYNVFKDVGTGIEHYYGATNGIIKNNKINAILDNSIKLTDVNNALVEHNEVDGKVTYNIVYGSKLDPGNESSTWRYNKVKCSMNINPMIVLEASNVTLDQNYFESTIGSQTINLVGLGTKNAIVTNNRCYTTNPTIINNASGNSIIESGNLKLESSEW